MDSKNRLLVCMSCGVEVRSMSRSNQDRKMGVERCMDCYNKEHAIEVVKRAKHKAKTNEERRIAQQEGRKAKAEALASSLDCVATTKEQRHNGTKASENKRRFDEISAKRELKLIEKEYE